jgi:hypothetical protein
MVRLRMWRDVDGGHRQSRQMPQRQGAEVKPHAKVYEIHHYSALCYECMWEGEQVESERTAEDDAAEHDSEKHADPTPKGPTA